MDGKLVTKFLYILILILLIQSVNAAEPIDLGRVYNRKPTIIVPFEEESLIVSAVLERNGETLPITFSTKDNKTYKFQPNNFLYNGDYTLTIDATDILGNPAEEPTPIYILFEIADLSIKLTEPSHGVSPTELFDITIKTGAKAECRYGLNVPLPYANSEKFDESDNRTHRIFDVNIEHGYKYILYVKCKDLFAVYSSKNFNLSVDTTKPKIDELNIEPDPINDYTSEDKFQTEVTAITDDDSICKFSLSGDDYEETEFYFDNYDKNNYGAYTTTNKVFISNTEHGIQNNKSYQVKVLCENKAELISDPITESFSVNLEAGLIITSNMPRYTSDTEIDLDVSTNRLASCFYGDTSGYISTPFEDTGGYNHFSELPVFVDGTYTYYVQCFSAEGQPKETITFTIDSTPPALNYIKYLPERRVVFEDNKYYTWYTKEIEAEWEFEDNETNIEEYNYSFVDEDGNFIVEWTLTDDNEIEIEEDSEGDELNLTDDETYTLQIKAKNIAGVWSEIYDEDIEIDLTLKPKDETPPEVTLVKETLAEGVKVTLVCKDVGEGCDLKTLHYSVSLSYCLPIENYTEPFLVTETSYVCWEVSDRAGNPAEGEEQVIVGPVVCNVDNDGDGYGLGCGPDCNDSDPAIHENCPSGCTQDTDGDGYGLGCPLGPDCDDTNPLIHKDCTSGCTQDTDGDGYGLGCEPDCDDSDPTIYTDCPSGCIQDTDGDGYGMGCEPDCDDFNPNIYENCPNGCVNDNDGDGYGKACDLGEDCDDTKPTIHENCISGCYIDNDGDQYGLGCPYGPDCNDLNPIIHEDCPSECTQDTDGDGYGMGCPLGPDCDDTNPLIHEDCTSGCTQDTDGDGYGLGCDLGLDCDDTNPSIHKNCPSGCTQDTDGDGYGMGCEPDCDDSDPAIYENCPSGCEIDLDGDGYGWKCTAGKDCDDTNSLIHEDCPSGCVQDTDGDGYGLGCILGPDCDDFDPVIYEDCTEDCTYDNDCDGMDDEWETENELDPDEDDSNEDPDCDGATNIEEYRAGTNPQEPPEGVFIDCDEDGAEDKCEKEYGFDPNNPLDGSEDTDGDGLTLAEECGYGTDPLNPDTDGDRWSDGKEIEKGTDPLDPLSHPKSKAWLWILIIILLIMAGVAGYYGYLWYQKKQAPAVPGKPAVGLPPAKAPGVKVPLTPEQRRLSILKEAARKRKELERKKREGIFEVFTGKKPKVAKHPKPEIIKHPKPKVIKPKPPMEKLGELVKGKSAFGKLEKLTEKKKLEEKLVKGAITKTEFDKLAELKKDEFDKLTSLVKKTGIEKLKPSVKKSYFEKLAGFGEKGEDVFKRLETTKKDEDIFKKLKTSLGKKEDIFKKLPVKK